MPARTPLNVVDRLILHFDRGSTPWNVQIEARVAGALDGARVAQAARAATARHPLARARLAPYRPYQRELAWEIADEPCDVPLTVVRCTTEDDVQRLRVEMLDQRLPLDAGVPFALALAHREGGDTLILNLNHVAADGVSAYRLLLSIARAYAGEPDGHPEDDAAEVRELREHVGTPLNGTPDPVWGERPRLPARAAIDGGTPTAPGYGIVHLGLDPTETASLLARRRQPATLNDVLLGGLAVAIRAFNAERGLAPGTVSMQMPLNLRPDTHANELVSNVVASVSVPVFAEEQSDVATAQLAAAERTAALKARRDAGGIIPSPGMVGSWPVGMVDLAMRVLGPRSASRIDTAVLSNLGRLEPVPAFGPDAGATTELWFSPPAKMPGGVAIGAATAGGALMLTVRYCREQFDADGAARFADTLRTTLLHD